MDINAKIESLKLVPVVVLEDAKKFQAADEKKLAAAKDGTANRAWVERTLEEKGYEIIDDVYHA